MRLHCTSVSNISPSKTILILLHLRLGHSEEQHSGMSSGNTYYVGVAPMVAWSALFRFSSRPGICQTPVKQRNHSRLNRDRSRSILIIIRREIRLPKKATTLALPNPPPPHPDKRIKHTSSKITRIIKLQLGHTAISSPSRRSSTAISNRSPQGHG